MDFLNFLWNQGLWISLLSFVVSVTLLAFFIVGIVRSGNKYKLAGFPLAAKQAVQFPEPGTVVLSMEGPRLSKRFSELSFQLRSSDGSSIESKNAWLHVTSAKISTIRMELLKFTIPKPGFYTLNTSNLGDRRERDEEHQIIFSKPHLPQTIGSVLGITLSAGMLIGSIVLFILRLLSKGGAS
jgi:hypothetical protein